MIRLQLIETQSQLSISAFCSSSSTFRRCRLLESTKGFGVLPSGLISYNGVKISLLLPNGFVTPSWRHKSVVFWQLGIECWHEAQ